jgi:hypothetical protein
MNLGGPLSAILCAGLLAAQVPSFDLKTLAAKITPQSLVVRDFNRDGRPDLAVSGSAAGAGGALEVLLR